MSRWELFYTGLCITLTIVLGLSTVTITSLQEEVNATHAKLYQLNAYINGVLTERGCPVSTGPMDKQLEE